MKKGAELYSRKQSCLKAASGIISDGEMKKPMMRNYGKHLKQRRQKMLRQVNPGSLILSLNVAAATFREVRDSVFPLQELSSKSRKY